MQRVLIMVLIACATAAADDQQQQRIAESKRIVSAFKAEFASPPKRTPNRASVDGPLLGNGDMGVVMAGHPEEQRFYLGKNDLWRLQHGYGKSSPVPFGYLAVRIPALQGASYKVTQDLYTATTEGVFKLNGSAVTMVSYVAATKNVMVLELTAEGASFEVDAALHVAKGRGSESVSGKEGDMFLGRRAFTEEVDIPSGAAVAWKVLGAGTSPRKTGQADAHARTVTHRVQLGREQFGGGRWNFKGDIDDLRVYGRSLGQEEINKLVTGKAPDEPAHAWSMDQQPGAHATMQVVPGKIGQAWRFTGDKDCFLDCGTMELPMDPVTMACWIKILDAAPEGNANYILSCGEWNRGISIGLSGGKLRFTAAGQFVESAVLPRNEWIHVAGTYDGSQLIAWVNGQKASFKAAGSGSLATVQEGTSFTLTPGQPVSLVLTMDSIFKNRNYLEVATMALADLSGRSDLSDLRRLHLAWWATYWARSYVRIHDPVIEQQYSLSLYGMGSCSRDPDFPPPIFGWTTTDAPAWHGDYHLNYNHMAPFYGLARANRLEQADPHDAPVLDFMERAQWHCRKIFGFEGVMYPVGIGPKGIETTYGNPSYISKGTRYAENNGLFFGQRSNGSYALVNMAPRWYTTYDLEYGKKIYPLVLNIATFWENYLTWDEATQRYLVEKDSVHEGSGQDLNACLSLGLIRNALLLALDLGKELKVDPDRRDKWRHILKHLSGYTFQEKNGKKVFRYTEKGTAWWDNNTLGIQQIYPAGAIHLDSDPELLEVSRNTIEVMQRWLDGNGSNSFFPATVRTGYDPVVILRELRKYSQHTYPNGFQTDNPHGIENLSTVPNTINEMLCMDHRGVLRLFPVWPTNRDASFVNIRCWGGFLVSGELKNGVVTQVRLLSEKGRVCTMVNPWLGKRAQLIRNGIEAKPLSGERFTFPTQAGEISELKSL